MIQVAPFLRACKYRLKGLSYRLRVQADVERQVSRSLEKVQPVTQSDVLLRSCKVVQFKVLLCAMQRLSHAQQRSDANAGS